MDVADPFVPGKIEELSSELKIEALIDYIATTPQNINYNILREILTALLNGDNHQYFDYYMTKVNQTEETEELPDLPAELDPANDLPTEPGDITDPGGGSSK